MPALNFIKQLAPLVETGQKNQTIRPPRKDGRNPKVDDRLYLYEGMRTKYCRKLGEGICTEVKPIILHTGIQLVHGPRIVIETDYLKPWENLRFAQDEGFQCVTDMCIFFNKRYKMPFHGLLIKWQNCKTFICSTCREKSGDPEDYTYSISELANPWELDEDFWICRECDMDGRDEKYLCEVD